MQTVRLGPGSWNRAAASLTSQHTGNIKRAICRRNDIVGIGDNLSEWKDTQFSVNAVSLKLMELKARQRVLQLPTGRL